MVSIGDRNRCEGALIFAAGAILGWANLVKATERGYSILPNQEQVTECHDVFWEELDREFELRRQDPAYIEQMELIESMARDYKDRELEYKLAPPCYDTTMDRDDKAKEFIEEIFKEAFERTLDRSEWCTDLKGGIKDDLKDFFGIKEKPAGAYRDSARKGNWGNSLLGGKLDAGIDHSVKLGELDKSKLSAYATVEGFRLLGARFQKAGVEVDTKKEVMAYLQNAISDRISYRFDFGLTGFHDTTSNVSASLTGEMKNGRWVVGVGYLDGDISGPYASLGIAQRF